jgi:4-hydroxybenzoate polyprenyltransferase
VKIDKLSRELLARPLVSGNITVKKAAVFAMGCMILSFLFSLIFYQDLGNYLFLLGILLFAYLLAAIYNFGSKKYPGMDFFVASAVFFLIIFGAATVGFPTLLAWVVAFIGGLQVLFMNMINGAIKDIDHDAKGMANTLAIKLGAKTQAGVVTLPVAFKTVGYLVELTRTVLIFVPFVFLSLNYHLVQVGILVVFTLLTFFFIFRLFSIKKFQRDQIRKNIALIVIFMYTTTPLMLSSLNIYIVLVALIPPLWFIFSNIVLHNTFLEPKTM